MKYFVECLKCGKKFEIECSESDFIKGNYRHTCSSKCAHSRKQTEKTKQQISKSLKKYFEPLKKDKQKFCKFCGKPTNGSFCCNECRKKSYIIPTLTKYYTFNEKLLGTSEAYSEYERVRQMLYNDYWVCNLTGGDIARKYGYNGCISNICGKLFRTLNIPPRNLSDTTKMNYIDGKLQPRSNNNVYKSEWHMTWNNKEVYLRSSYEIDYANELDAQKIDYEVEALRIKYWNTKKNGYHCAIPDFYLPDSNTIVEIKSNYTLDVQEMKDKAIVYKKLGYNFKLVLEHQIVNIEDL